MSLRKLYEKFRGVTSLPIEVPEIRQAIYDLGTQDQIILCGRTLNPEELGGVFHQFTTRPKLYADPVLTTLIIFPNNAPIPVQRIICAKEMIHVMDRSVERVNTPLMLEELIDKLLGPLSTEDFGIPDLIAAGDKMAIYRCIPLLFPIAARNEALKMLKNNNITLEELIKQTSLTKRVVELVLSDQWVDAEKE